MVRNQLITLAAALALGTGALAQDREPAGAVSGTTAVRPAGGSGDQQILAELQKIAGSPETAGDKLFVLHNACGNLKEMRMSQLVAKRTQNDDLKELANMIASDHQQAQEKLQPVAKELGVTLPTELSSEKQQELAIKEKMPVADLEKGYLADMKAAHAKDITMFSDHAQLAKSDSVKAYIGQVLPKLKMHGQHVVQLAQKMGINGGLAGGGAGGDVGSGRTEENRTGNVTPPKMNER